MTANERATFPHVKALVVEDYDLNLDIIVDMLKILGIEPDTAVNGQEALEKAEKSTYNLILMDIRMPILDGYQATQAIRKLDIPQPLIIALTASSALREKQKFEEVGMDDFLIKPIELHHLEKMLLKHFKTNLSPHPNPRT